MSTNGAITYYPEPEIPNENSRILLYRHIERGFISAKFLALFVAVFFSLLTMSIEIMRQVWSHTEKAGTDLLVMLALSDCADDEGYCYPSIKTIAKKARVSPRRCQGVIKKLQEDGYISKEESFSKNGRQTSNRYTIFPHGNRVENIDDGEGVTRNTHVTHDRGEGVTHDRGEGVTHDTPITLNHKIEPSVIESSTTMSKGDNQPDLFPSVSNSTSEKLPSPDSIIDLYHSTCTKLEKVKVADDTLKRAIRSRCHDIIKVGHNPTEAFQAIFNHLSASDWHCGENGSGWRAGLRWLVDKKPKFMKQLDAAMSIKEHGDRKRLSPNDPGYYQQTKDEW